MPKPEAMATVSPSDTIAIRPSTSSYSRRTATVDAYLIAILDEPIPAGDSPHDGMLRKERALLSAISWLVPDTARSLHARLARPQHGDELALKFCRLTLACRLRLLTAIFDRRTAGAGR